MTLARHVPSAPPGIVIFHPTSMWSGSSEVITAGLEGAGRCIVELHVAGGVVELGLGDVPQGVVRLDGVAAVLPVLVVASGLRW